MPFRSVDAFLSKENHERLLGRLEDIEAVGIWLSEADQGGYLVKIVVDAEKAEGLLEELEGICGDETQDRVIMHETQLVVPSIKDEDEGDDDRVETQDEVPGEGGVLARIKQEFTRLSREEVTEEVYGQVTFSIVFLLLTGLSAIVAASGLYKDSAPVIVGSMVIARLIGPSVGLAFAATLADGRLALRSGAIALAAIVLIIGIAAGIGALFEPDTQGNEMVASFSQVDPADLAVSLTAGSAGVLVLATGLGTALVGVMVALALLPALTMTGIFLGAGDWSGALGAASLAGMQLIAVNLAGIVAFLALGFRPGSHREEERARWSRGIAITIWLGLLGALGAVLWLT